MDLMSLSLRVKIWITSGVDVADGHVVGVFFILGLEGLEPLARNRRCRSIADGDLGVLAAQEAHISSEPPVAGPSHSTRRIFWFHTWAMATTQGMKVPETPPRQRAAWCLAKPLAGGQKEEKPGRRLSITCLNAFHDDALLVGGCKGWIHTHCPNGIRCYISFS